MWIVILLLAAIPIFFFWSDAAIKLVPSMANVLPQPKDSRTGQAVDEQLNALDKAMHAATTWTIANTDAGYTAWMVSGDGQYRLVTGCQTGQRAALQLTKLEGNVQPALVVDYQFGSIPLKNGYYAGEELVGAVSQAREVSVKDDQGRLIASFRADGLSSEAVARDLTQNCVR